LELEPQWSDFREGCLEQEYLREEPILRAGKHVLCKEENHAIFIDIEIMCTCHA